MFRLGARGKNIRYLWLGGKRRRGAKHMAYLRENKIGILQALDDYARSHLTYKELCLGSGLCFPCYILLTPLHRPYIPSAPLIARGYSRQPGDSCCGAPLQYFGLKCPSDPSLRAESRLDNRATNNAVVPICVNCYVLPFMRYVVDVPPWLGML